MNVKRPIEVKKRFAILFAVSVGLININARSQEPVWTKNPPQAIPKGALAIEKKFDLVFYETYETYTMFTHIKYPTWVFTKQMPKNFLATIAFCVPANARDETVEKCLNAALYCAGWHQGWMEFQIQQRAMVTPDKLTPVPVSSPTPLTDHT